jgi:hypothetical protein
MGIKLGSTVRQIVPAPEAGTVVKKQFVEATDTFQFLVEYAPDADGHAASRWFEESEIELVDPA